VNDIRELFTELAETSGPPSVWDTGRAYRRGRRRRRLRDTGGVVAVVAVIGLAITVVLTGLGAAGHRPAQRRPPAGTADPSADAIPAGTVLWVEATDAQHLYAVVAARCDTAESCANTLLGSDDGGRTWSVRWQYRNRFLVHAYPSGALTLDPPDILPATDARHGTVTEPADAAGGWLSRDGGRTWFTPTQRTAPVTAVPTGGWLQAHLSRSGDGDQNHDANSVEVVDPVGGWVAPLAATPPVDRVGRVTQLDDHTIWVTDGKSGPGDEARIAVSGDAGRTWSAHTFSGLVGPRQFTESMFVASHDGRTIYATVAAGGDPIGGRQPRSYVFRSDDAGISWQPVDPTGTAPRLEGDAATIVTPDGTHLLADAPSDRSDRTMTAVTFVASTDGGASYRPVILDGLPGQLSQEGDRLRQFTGGYLAFTDDTVYMSTDGLTWQPHRVRV
jgi:hypothetical protein